MGKPKYITEIVNIKEVKNNPNNPRLIKDDKFKKLVQSIKNFPEMLNIRPIVVNENMVILGGNMRYKACLEAGLKEVPIIKVDGLTEEKQREFIIKDNVSGGEWDWDMLANEWESEELEEWGLDIPVFEIEEEKDDDEVNVKDLFDIEIPFYKASEISPSIEDLADISNVKELINKIDNLDIDNELKEILKIRASFFCDFNFQKIADFYHHSDKEVKEVFEDLGLVILTPKEALKKGFIRISENILEL